MRRFCLGKKPALLDTRTLQLALYLKKPELPPLPRAVNYGAAVTRWPMYANDRYADCTCAAAGHMIQSWRANTGVRPRKPTTAQVVSFYSYFTAPGPENAIEVLRVLKHWRSTGLAGDKIHAFMQLRLNNIDEVKHSIQLFGGCYIGVVLPRFLMKLADPSKPRWAVPPEGRHGEGERDPNGGHAIPAFAYDAQHLYVVTWGAVKAMTWDFYLAYADEAYAILSHDWLRNGRAPSGFDFAQLQSDLHAI